MKEKLSAFHHNETFSLLKQPTTICLVLALAVMNKWSVRQLDVKNAFLHGYLKETVFMEQSPGFVSTDHLEYVCRLKRALYGLKQAPNLVKGLESLLVVASAPCSFLAE